jgi:hypothetical protein
MWSSGYRAHMQTPRLHSRPAAQSASLLQPHFQPLGFPKPSTQAEPAGLLLHELLQLPQCVAEVRSVSQPSAQLPLQLPNQPPHAHVPDWQLLFGPQSLPQLPQLLASVARSLQPFAGSPSQSCVPESQLHRDPPHVMFLGQLLFSPSGVLFKQQSTPRRTSQPFAESPSQSLRPWAQTQAPETHSMFARHQLPQLPQFLRSVCRSLHPSSGSPLQST